jgi:hypothetical protein
VVLDGLGIAPKSMISISEVPVRLALPRPVAHLLCDRQLLRVVLDGLGIVPHDSYALPRMQQTHAALPGIEVRTVAATALAARSCAATPRQSAAPSS